MEMGAEFLKKVLAFYPYTINYVLTDNGPEFRHPWTNGMIERFNGKVKTKVIKRYLFEGKEDLTKEIIDYCNRYNFEIKLKQLKYKTPVDFLQSTYHHCIQRIVI